MTTTDRTDDGGLSDRLARCYTGAVHDVMHAMGLTSFTLPPTIRPVLPEKRIAGPIYTVSGHVDRDADAHETLVQWTGLLSQAKPGHVVICQPNDDVVAHMGELSAETLQFRGIRGYIADGGCRDVDFILSIGFPVFCRYYTPRDVVGYWVPDGFDVPITIGDVRINPGDYVVGDRDGVIVIPSDQVSTVVSRAEEAMQTENKVRTAILQGVDPQQAYLTHGKF